MQIEFRVSLILDYRNSEQYYEFSDIKLNDSIMVDSFYYYSDKLILDIEKTKEYKHTHERLILEKLLKSDEWKVFNRQLKLERICKKY